MRKNQLLTRKSKLFIIFIVIIFIFSINIHLLSYIGADHSNIIDYKDKIERKIPIPKINTISENNEYTGLGAPWNITRYANRTEKDLNIQFNEGERDLINFPLYSGWEGYKLKTNVSNLYDTRNWVNGTFNEGIDDGDGTCPSNDSADVLNWTFTENDASSNNNMAGNYFNGSSNDPIQGKNYLELRMDGYYFNDSELGERYQYNQDDECSWYSNINIPRGRIINSTFKFEINPFHVADFNSWEVLLRINDIKVYSYGLYDLGGISGGGWKNYSIAQSRWLNTTNIFPTGPVESSNIKVELALVYSSTSANYGDEDGENVDYQQVFFDNIKLITTAEAKPTDLNLKINNTDVTDISWGKGYVDISALETNWIPDNMNNTYFEFQTEDVGILGNYYVDLKADMNVFAVKHSPESNYETNENSLGTSFSITNKSQANWLSYCFVDVPEKYAETRLTVSFPSDINITDVYDPQNPSINILNLCDDSTPGLLNIPLENISLTPDGFWELNAKSPNYCSDLDLYSNSTGTWIKTNDIYAGNYLNITAKIENSTMVSDYLNDTFAYATLKFPNGSLWTNKITFSKPDENGNINFPLIRIPNNSINYIAGKYEVIITWNNSYNSFDLNETGLIYKEFNVIHRSILIAEKDYYKDNFNDTIVNLRVTFNDSINNKPIEDAKIYTYNFTNSGLENYFSEISPGFYLLEFNISGGSVGDNNITIYANSSYYENQQIDITIELINETKLLVETGFISNANYDQNFTLQFNYSDKATGLGINTSEIAINWKASFSVHRIAQGVYILTANASSEFYEAGKLYNLTISITKVGYEKQVKLIDVFITELESYIELEINGNVIEPNDILTVSVRDQLNITVFYKDFNNDSIGGANVFLQLGNDSESFTEVPSLNNYYFNLNATALGQGIDNLVVYAEKTNYKPSSIPFIVEIIEIETNIEIYFDGVNKTSDPIIEVPIGTMINISVKYFDLFGQYIEGATVELEGDITIALFENKTLKQYYYLLNTSNLDIGLRSLELKAIRKNFETQTKILRIQVRKIQTQINFIKGGSVINLSPGESTNIEITLINLETNESIIGATINYTWVFGKGVFTDENNDGIYNTTIGGALDGSYKLIISPSVSENYDFQSFEITITIIRPEGEFLAVQVGTIATSFSAIIVGAYLLLYLTILKYPKQVRKVRKFRKSLKKESAPSVDITNREKGFREKFNSESPQRSKVVGKKFKKKISEKKKGGGPK